MRQWWRAQGPPGYQGELKIEESLYIPVKPSQSLVVADYVELYDYEVEAFKLIHYDGLTTDEASVKMGLSKATFWRILEQARFKIARALVENKPIRIVVSQRLSPQNPLS
jgi:predicted DNA-binding protein (UPF0251 family)